MAIASLAGYDGTAGTLVDTNIWIDCMDPGSRWHDWAVEQLQLLSERSPLHVNLVIYTELLVPGPDIAALDGLLDVYETLRTPLPWTCASLTAAAFALYRKPAAWARVRQTGSVQDLFPEAGGGSPRLMIASPTGSVSATDSGRMPALGRAGGDLGGLIGPGSAAFACPADRNGACPARRPLLVSSTG